MEIELIRAQCLRASARAPILNAKQKQKIIYIYRKFGDAARESHQKTATSTLLILLFLFLLSLLLLVLLCSTKSFAFAQTLWIRRILSILFLCALHTHTNPYVGAQLADSIVWNHRKSQYVPIADFQYKLQPLWLHKVKQCIVFVATAFRRRWS